MTEIAFHFNLPDKTAYVCRLLRKAVAHGARVAVSGEQPLMAELDKALWSFSATDFVPHCSAASDAAIVCEALKPSANRSRDLGARDFRRWFHGFLATMPTLSRPSN